MESTTFSENNIALQKAILQALQVSNLILSYNANIHAYSVL